MNYALSNDIYVGSLSAPLYHFTNQDLVLNSAKGVFSVDTLGNELSIDQFTVTIRWTEDENYNGFITSEDDVFLTNADEEFLVLFRAGISPVLRDFMKELPFGTPVWWYVDGDFCSKGYLKSVDRVGRNSFTLTCISGVGLLDMKIHVGNLYTGQTVGAIVAEIIGSTISYTVANDLASVQVYGHLPYDTARANLHRLLFAVGAALTREDEDTDYAIGYLSNTMTTVPASRVALSGRVDYQLPANKVEITEHGFFQTATDETVTLFDNTNGAAVSNLVVVFRQAPAYDLQASGALTISESGVNYAVVSGVGLLTGKVYSHTQHLVTINEMQAGDAERVKRVTANELISAMNSRNVAQRVMAFYRSAKTVKAKLMLADEKCGSLLQMTDAFGDIMSGFLQRMEITPTTIKGADCQLIEGYVPGNNGNNFNNRVAITASGSWTVPAGVTYIRIVLIGGGDGGSGGYDGEEGAVKTTNPGKEVSTYTNELVTDRLYYVVYYYANAQQRTPAGGAAGEAGTPGKIYIVEQAVTPGEVITFSIGTGGTGGAHNGEAGTSGTDTTATSTSIGSISSASGLSGQGYYDPLTGNVYAAPGAAGYAGGNGGRTDVVSLVGNNGANGLSGGGIAGYIGGAGGVGVIHEQRSQWGSAYTRVAHASGGGGGGAAYGASGNPGGDASFTERHYEGEYLYQDQIDTGGGGDGANAQPPAKPTYGNGGGAGNGGGGGGNCGGGDGLTGFYANDEKVNYANRGGAGGLGSVGGAGGDGIALIYH